jgi:hypothetical protein
MNVENGYLIRETVWHVKTFIIDKSVVPLDKVGDFVEESCSKIYSTLTNLGTPVSSPPCAIFFSSKPGIPHTEVAAGIPCEDAEQNCGKFQKISLKGKLVYTTVKGYFSGVPKAYELLEEYIKKKNMKQVMAIEEYHCNCIEEPDMNNWKTRIYLLLEDKE